MVDKKYLDYVQFYLCNINDNTNLVSITTAKSSWSYNFILFDRVIIFVCVFIFLSIFFFHKLYFFFKFTKNKLFLAKWTLYFVFFHFPETLLTIPRCIFKKLLKYHYECHWVIFFSMFYLGRKRKVEIAFKFSRFLLR